MASELIVQTLKGPTSGANANKVIIPSGQTLECANAIMAPGSILQTSTGLFTTNQQTGSTSFVDTEITKTLTAVGTNSKFHITVVVGLNLYYNIRADYRLVQRISGNDVALQTNILFSPYDNNSNTDTIGAITYIDSPSLSAGSDVTYMIQVRQTSGEFLYVGDNQDSSLSIMEIAG